MTNVFKQISSNTQPFVLFAWPLGCLLVALAVILMIEDYETSRAGYLALPTLKVHGGWVTFAVAALPQAGQIVLFYIFGRDTRRGWAMLLAGGLFLVDLGTDAWFKSGGQWSLVPLAVVESLFIFTLGSEVLFTIATGFVAETFSDFVVAFSVFLRTILDAFRSALETLGIGESDR
jgi:hypothetical protein